MEFSLEEVMALSASCFVQVGFSIEKSEGFGKNPFQAPFLLPSCSELLDQEEFAKVAISYEEKGIHIAIEIDQPFEQVFFPKVEDGDGVEIFIDTKDIKTTGSLHRFCHHFVFLPKPVANITACEVTRLRMEDSHPLADSAFLHVKPIFLKNSYQLYLFIDTQALFGFDPSETTSIGFSYKIHRSKGASQEFNHSSQEFLIEKYPYLWASMQLKRS